MLVLATIPVARRVGRSLDLPPFNVVALAAGLALVIAFTLTPTREALRFGLTTAGIGCDLSDPVASLRTYLSINERSLNVALLVPLGIAIGLLPRHRLPFLALGILLPFVVEALQLALPVLDRTCQGRDLVDNVAGLLIGVVLGLGAWGLATVTERG